LRSQDDYAKCTEVSFHTELSVLLPGNEEILEAFLGIIPLMEAQEMAARLYLNFLHLNGEAKGPPARAFQNLRKR